MFSRLNQISKKDVEQALYLGKNRVLYIASISETLDKKTLLPIIEESFEFFRALVWFDSFLQKSRTAKELFVRVS